MPPIDPDAIFFHSPDFTDPLAVRAMHGREAISELYELRVELRLDAPLEDSELESLLKHGGYVAYGPDNAHRFHGAVRAIDIAPHPLGATHGYTLTLVPRLWYTTQTVRSRLYLDKTAPDIVRAVLAEAGLEHVDYRLSATHPQREYTVQYEESDFAFVSRLLEYEGIFFYFEQGDDHETLVICDANTALSTLDGHAAVPYRPLRGGAAFEFGVRQLQKHLRVVPRAVHARDFNHARAAAVQANDRLAGIDESAWPADRVGHGLVVLFGDKLASASDAARVARLRAEEIACRKQVYTGEVDVAGLHPGYAFTLEEHALADFGQAYVITAMEHSAQPGAFAAQSRDEAAGDDDDSLRYTATFEAVPRSVPYRPARITPRPTIAGVVHAKIDGQNHDTAAPLDEQGRYKVVLPFDCVGAPGGRASCAMRLAQPYAGPAYGLHLPLHQGAEVLVAHAQGDPDQPVILAAVPNPETPSPFDSTQAVRGGMVSRSQVRIEFDDDA